MKCMKKILFLGIFCSTKNFIFEFYELFFPCRFFEKKINVDKRIFFVQNVLKRLPEKSDFMELIFFLILEKNFLKNPKNSYSLLRTF